MAVSTLDFRNVNSLWCSVLVETLARLGLRHAVVSPGSRSTPLTVAFAGHPRVEAIPVLDERSAAFFALGLAKRHHSPVALICTSGTAAANYLPAIVEAHESGVPLLVLTADRPPELRDCRSGQTIDQSKLYGSHVGFHHELAVPETSPERLRYLRQTIAHAWTCAAGPVPGPAHLNCPFRDPLPPVADGTTARLRRSFASEKFFGHLPQPATGRSHGLRLAFPERRRGLRGVIVAGPASPRNATYYAARLTALSASLGWPVLADALSPLRHRARSALPIVTAYDTILRSRRLAARLKPDVVLAIEGWPTSKRLRGWLQACDAETWLVNPSAANADGLHGRTHHLRCHATDLLVEPVGADKTWLQAWQQAEAHARGGLYERVDACDWLFEGGVSQRLPGLLPAGTPVFVASSMSVRDAECFWPATERRHALYFNRGANGIDGTLSTALGVAHGGRPTVLLTGDLALLHDTNGFLMRPKLRGSLTIVLVDNRGGGIFEHLQVAKFDPPFEEFFAMPQQVDFAALCAAYGVEHVRVTDWKHFESLVSRLPASGLRVVEVHTDRKRDAAFRRQLFTEVAASLR